MFYARDHRTATTPLRGADRARTMFRTLKQRIQIRHGVRDLEKMQKLVRCFAAAMQDVAGSAGREQTLDPVELSILATFVVSEIYLGIAPDKDFAYSVLDEYHEMEAEHLFDAEVESLEVRVSGRDASDLYDKFMDRVYAMTKERYIEYRSILFDKHGRPRLGESFVRLGRHLLAPSETFGESNPIVLLRFQLAFIDHLVRCGKAFRVPR